MISDASLHLDKKLSLTIEEQNELLVPESTPTVVNTTVAIRTAHMLSGSYEMSANSVGDASRALVIEHGSANRALLAACLGGQLDILRVPCL